MTVPRWAPTLSATFALSLVLALAGCASGAPSVASGAANSPETAKAYSDCLTAEGIDGVFTDDEGYVGVSIEVGPSGDPGGSGDSGDSSFHLDSGPGSAYSEAETKCRADVPAYHPRVDAEDPALTAKMLDQSLAFTSCARQNGLADFPDPDAGAGGKLVVPDGTTKAQFLAVVTACASTFAAEVSPPADGGAVGGGSSDGAMTIAMPEFTGAYESSWSSEVTDIIFAAMLPSTAPVP